MLGKMRQSLKRDFWNGPVGERGDFKVFRGIRGTKM